MSARGSVTVMLNGREVRLLMTLGALAEIEEKLNVDNINEALAFVGTGKVSAIMVIFAALARGGGTELTDEEIAAFNFLEVADALTRALDSSFPAEEDADAAGPEGAGVKNP